MQQTKTIEEQKTLELIKRNGGRYKLNPEVTELL